MTRDGFAGDVRRQAGWLPASQDALEDWLAGHRQRVEAKGQSSRASWLAGSQPA